MQQQVVVRHNQTSQFKAGMHRGGTVMQEESKLPQKEAVTDGFSRRPASTRVQPNVSCKTTERKDSGDPRLQKQSRDYGKDGIHSLHGSVILDLTQQTKLIDLSSQCKARRRSANNSEAAIVKPQKKSSIKENYNPGGNREVTSGRGTSKQTTEDATTKRKQSSIILNSGQTLMPRRGGSNENGLMQSGRLVITENKKVNREVTTTIRKNTVIPACKVSDSVRTANLAKTQQVFTKQLFSQSKRYNEASPIRKFNEDEYMQEGIRLEKKDLVVSEIQTPHVAAIGLSSGQLPHYQGELQSANNAPIKLVHSGRVYQSREHDDDAMALSPFKTPRSGDNSLSPLKSSSPSHNKVYHFPGDENIQSSTQSKQINLGARVPSQPESRFKMPNLQFNLISSLIPALHPCSKDVRVLNNLSPQYSSSKRVGVNIMSQQSFMQDSAEHQSRKCISPLKKIFSCCNNPYFLTQNSNTMNRDLQPKKGVREYNTPVSRNQQSSHIRDMIKLPSSVMKSEECIIEDVDEYLDEQKHRLSIKKRLNINSCVMSPGGRIQQQRGPAATLFAQTTRQMEPAIILQSEESNPEEQDPNLESLHYQQVLSALQIIKHNLVAPDIADLKPNFFSLPPPNAPHKTKTIIFDMDETLVHCVDDYEEDDPDVILEIVFPENDEPVKAGFNLRPYILECLAEANKYFQVGVFTASHQSYADAILDFIDPDNQYFQFRLYRDSCIMVGENYYVKDLRIFQNRSLKDLVLIDNSVYSFAFQIENGVPIIPFYRDQNDEELYHLMSYMHDIYKVEDIRHHNKQAFHLLELANQELIDEEDNDSSCYRCSSSTSSLAPPQVKRAK